METSPPPRQATDLTSKLYYQVVYTLTDLLPPPIDGSPEALQARNQTAIAKVAALLPVNANELDLAAQCIAARAQAEDILRLLRQNTDDINLIIRLNAQYSSMVRTSLSVHARLMRVQAVRQKREAIEGAATQDAWTQHITEQSMLKVADPDIERLEAARPKAAPVPHRDQKIDENVSKNKTNSHGAAFETTVSNQPRNQGASGSGQIGLLKRIREAMAEPGWAGWELPANGPKNPGLPDLGPPSP